MKPKKLKKLVLKKETISNLTENAMSYIKGGNETDGTGLGMCICNATDDCCNTNFPGSCGGAGTTGYGGCGCT